MHEEGAYGPTVRSGVFFCLPLSRAVVHAAVLTFCFGLVFIVVFLFSFLVWFLLFYFSLGGGRGCYSFFVVLFVSLFSCFFVGGGGTFCLLESVVVFVDGVETNRVCDRFHLSCHLDCHTPSSGVARGVRLDSFYSHTHTRTHAHTHTHTTKIKQKHRINR